MHSIPKRNMDGVLTSGSIEPTMRSGDACSEDTDPMDFVSVSCPVPTGLVGTNCSIVVLQATRLHDASGANLNSVATIRASTWRGRRAWSIERLVLVSDFAIQRFPHAEHPDQRKVFGRWDGRPQQTVVACILAPAG